MNLVDANPEQRVNAKHQQHKANKAEQFGDATVRKGVNAKIRAILDDITVAAVAAAQAQQD